MLPYLGLWFAIFLQVFRPAFAVGLPKYYNLCHKDELVGIQDARGMIQYHGYPVETHVVTSQDGYRNTLFRIPRGISTTKCFREPVLLFHGIMSSAAQWLVLERNKNLPFILAENCSDVWLANMRGSKYSMGHVTLSSRDPQYWDFSLDEVGKFDLPAMIDYILKTSGGDLSKFDKLNYVGYSAGTSAMFICLHYHPEYNLKLRKMALLAPTAYLDEAKPAFIREFVDLTFPLLPSAELAFTILFRGVYFPLRLYSLLRTFLPRVCSLDTTEPSPCKLVADIGGISQFRTNFTVGCRAIANFPEITSARTMLHLAQLITSGQFRSYQRSESPPTLRELGFAVNEVLRRGARMLAKLGLPNLTADFETAQKLAQTLVDGRSAQSLRAIIQSLVPDQDLAMALSSSKNATAGLKAKPINYDLGRVKVPVFGFVGSEDVLITINNAGRTMKELGSKVKKLTILYGWNHFDLSLLDNCAQEVFYPIRDFFQDARKTGD